MHPTATIINGNRSDPRPAPSLPNPQASPGPYYRSFDDKYDAYAKVELKRNGLTITKEPEPQWQRLKSTSEKVQWQWELKPTDDMAATASFWFEVNIMWVANRIESVADVPVRVWGYKWDESGEPFGELTVGFVDNGSELRSTLVRILRISRAGDW